MRSERPFSSVSDNYISYHQSSHSPPVSLVGFNPLSAFSFNSSATDLFHRTTKGKSSALLTAAKHGKGHLDKAMRYPSSIATLPTPDKCTDPIWLLGVQHPFPSEAASPTLSRSGSVNSRRAHSFRTSTSSTVAAKARSGHHNCHRKTQAHIGRRQNSTQMLRHASGLHIAPIFTPSRLITYCPRT
jgi:cysteine protease ATG4